jgi:hypothetical protein
MRVAQLQCPQTYARGILVLRERLFSSHCPSCPFAPLGAGSQTARGQGEHLGWCKSGSFPTTTHCECYMPQVLAIREWFATQRSFCFYQASLLFAYEGTAEDLQGANVQVDTASCATCHMFVARTALPQLPCALLRDDRLSTGTLASRCDAGAITAPRVCRFLWLPLMRTHVTSRALIRLCMSAGTTPGAPY